ncbi:MAG: hypothetical protein DRI90_22080 [Deltaproteobacteria bacterium]|nr:MAG: hypothetical protein DRI90_22080 [Deltaproteobacteria bacterium]
MAFRHVLLALVAFSLGGCLETNRQQVERLAPDCQVKREQLRRTAALLPPPSEPPTLTVDELFQ